MCLYRFCLLYDRFMFHPKIHLLVYCYLQIYLHLQMYLYSVLYGGLLRITQGSEVLRSNQPQQQCESA